MVTSQRVETPKLPATTDTRVYFWVVWSIKGLLKSTSGRVAALRRAAGTNLMVNLVCMRRGVCEGDLLGHPGGATELAACAELWISGSLSNCH